MKSKFFEPLAVLVAGGSSIKAAAGVVNCSEQTAYNLSATEPFRTRVSELRSQFTAEACGILTQGATRAAQTLVDLLSSDNEAKDRLTAARLILANLAPVQELGELRARLDRLEGQASLRIA